MDKTNDRQTRIALIGAGGVASYLLPVFLKVEPEALWTIFDKDVLEERNLDRQLFDPMLIGKNKATALAETLNLGERTIREEFFTVATQLEDVDLIICTVDNHPARLAAIFKAEELDIPIIIGANEYFDSEAYIYFPEWRGTMMDPRIRYPEILTDKTGDPISCQGEAAVANPQLPLANMSCASKIAQLYWVWIKTFNAEETQFLPVEISDNRFATERLTIKSIENATATD